MKYCVSAMQEYAKLKCQELLEIVSEKAKTVSVGSEFNSWEEVDTHSILNAVDLESFCK